MELLHATSMAQRGVRGKALFVTSGLRRRVDTVRARRPGRNVKMVIGLAGAEFLVRCRQEGVNFGRTLTLGRQHLVVSPFHLERLLKRSDCWPDGLPVQACLESLAVSPYYADAFLRALGAEQVSALDASAYEGADTVHDLGLPIPSDLQRSFDLVSDGGLLEHVFNVPAALKNAMELVRVGGTSF